MKQDRGQPMPHNSPPSRPPSVVSWQDGWSPLHSACYKGHVDVVKALIASGADVQATANVSRAERGWVGGVCFEREQVRESKGMRNPNRAGHMRHTARSSAGAPRRVTSPCVALPRCAAARASRLYRMLRHSRGGLLAAAARASEHVKQHVYRRRRTCCCMFV
jgi:hypothetical protein